MGCMLKTKNLQINVVALKIKQLRRVNVAEIHYETIDSNKLSKKMDLNRL